MFLLNPLDGHAKTLGVAAVHPGENMVYDCSKGLSRQQTAEPVKVIGQHGLPSRHVKRGARIVSGYARGADGVPAGMNNTALPDADLLSARERAAEIVAILAAVILREQCPTVPADTDLGLGFVPGQSVHATPSQRELS